MADGIVVRNGAEVEYDRDTLARVVESVVLRGDISALNPEERARYYIQTCEQLGLNAASQPLAILRLNGKEVLYPTKGATDQLAALHKLTREVIDGPRVIDLAGTKLVYCVCKATHPNGRTETAVSTVPLTDPVNVLMKCETKGKRRVTLSILGLGMLDETELETIPASAKSEGSPIDLGAISSAVRDQQVRDEVVRDLSTLGRLRDELASAETLDAVCAVWGENSSDIAEEDTGPDGESRGLLSKARRLVCDRVVVLQLAKSVTAADKLIKERCYALAQAKQAPAPAAVEEAPVAPPVLPAAYLEALAAATSPEDAVEVYREHGPAISLEADGKSKTALYMPALEAVRARCVQLMVKPEDVAAWVKAQIAKGAPKGDGPKGGKRAKPTAAPASAHGSSAETTQGNGAQASVSYLVPHVESARYVASAAEWEAHCLAYKSKENALNSWAKHVAAFRSAGVFAERRRVAALRYQALTNCIDTDVAAKGLDLAERTAEANARKHAEAATTLRKAG